MICSYDEIMQWVEEEYAGKYFKNFVQEFSLIFAQNFKFSETNFSLSFNLLQLWERVLWTFQMNVIFTFWTPTLLFFRTQTTHVIWILYYQTTLVCSSLSDGWAMTSSSMRIKSRLTSWGMIIHSLFDFFVMWHKSLVCYNGKIILIIVPFGSLDPVVTALKVA